MEKLSRASMRSAALLFWTAGMYTTMVGAYLLLYPWRARALSARFRLLSCWGRGVVRLLGGRVEVRGAPPERPFFLVSNHLSYIDIPILYTRLHANFLAKWEVGASPLFGVLARSIGTLFVRRENKSDLTRVIREVEHRLARGEGVVVFPEGTSTRGERVLPFKPSLFEVAVRTGSPVSYASITYRTPPGSPSAEQSICWWGDMQFFPHLYQLLTLPTFQATLTFGPEPIVAGDRKTLATRAHSAVEQSFTPVASCRAS
jgi:1-acyl-sn-glycerol-3-phosphate acyltransferase